MAPDVERSHAGGHTAHFMSAPAINMASVVETALADYLTPTVSAAPPDHGRI
jgi:hypothetical protein